MTEKIPVKALAEADLFHTESAQRFYTIKPPASHQRADLLQSSYWKHVLRKLMEGTEIRAWPKGGAWYGRYLVRYVEGMEVKVVELEYHQFETIGLANETADFRVDLMDSGKYRVMRKADKTVVREGFASQETAMRWITEFLVKKAA